MSVVRRTAAVAVASGFTALAGLVPALPAMAHGATTQPISRTAACATGGKDVDSAACRAARAANGGPFGNFDNLRVPGVNGKDKQYLAEGNLCSGDLPDFQGLDLARDDWPATRLTAGETISIRYATTIPHEGEFRVYLTKQGYDPKKPLGWDDLGASPIITATDPPLRAGAYRFSGKLPANRSGRHVLYVVWQNSSTPDTYYSCSDLILKADSAAAAAPAKNSTKAKPLSTRAPEPGAVASPAGAAGPTTAPGAPAVRESWLTKAEDDEQVALGRHVVTAALIVLSGVTAGAAIIRMRRGRAAQRSPGRFEDR